MTCSAPTKSGAPCRNPAVYALPGESEPSVCEWHDPDLKRLHDFAAAGGAKGAASQKRRKEALAERAAATVPLDSLENILHFLERAAARSEQLGDGKLALSAARVAAEARNLLPIAELQKENAELRRLLGIKNLKAVK